MGTRRRARRNKRSRRKRGGVILTRTPGQDIMPELQRFVAEGKIEFVNAGTFGATFKISLPEESPVLSGVNTILVKVVSIGKSNTMIYNHEEDGEKEEIELHGIDKEEFEREIEVHQTVCESSIHYFGVSIAPTLLHVEIYNKKSLSIFSKIDEHIETDGDIGLVFMEFISSSAGPAGTLYDYYEQPKSKDYTIKHLLPTARRLLIMLAQLGFYHNDFHLGNILYNEKYCLLIDFGKATRIQEDILVKFNRDVKEYDTNSDPSSKPSLQKKILTFLYGKNAPIDKVQSSERATAYFLVRQWLISNQKEEYVSIDDAEDVEIETYKNVAGRIWKEAGEITKELTISPMFTRRADSAAAAEYRPPSAAEPPRPPSAAAEPRPPTAAEPRPPSTASKPSRAERLAAERAKAAEEPKEDNYYVW